MEHSKTEVFHFSRLQGPFNPPPLNLSPIGGPILYPKESWRYLGFIFDRKLLFHNHINFYVNKVILTVKCMKILGNSMRGLNPHQKYFLYRSCAMPIVLYGFQLWHYNKASLLYPLKILNKMQRRAALWIVGAFKISPSLGVEAIAGLIPINLHLQKLSSRSQLWAYLLSHNHILRSLMDTSSITPSHQHTLSLSSLIRWQKGLIKGHLVDMDNCYNEVFPSFDLLNLEFSPGNRIIDSFSNCFSFHLFSKHSDQNIKSYIQQLDNLILESLDSPSNTLIVMDANIKNNIAISILHIHICNKPIIKTLHHVLNIMSSEAELFAIRCGINQAINYIGILKIIVVMDSIHMAKKIFDVSTHSFQNQLAFILKKLWTFFSCHQENSIKFWECLSHCN